MTAFINTTLLPISLAVIMLSIGLSVKWADFTLLKRQKSAIFAGFFLQILALPALVFVLVSAIGLPPQYAVALMIVACCPGGVTSNAITFIFSGVVALSMVLTLLSSLVAPLSIPLVTGWSLQYFMGDSGTYDFDLLPAVLKLMMISIVPLLIGAAVQRIKPQWSQRHRQRFKRLSGLLFATVIVLIAAVNYHLLSQVLIELGGIMLLIALAATIMGYVGGKVLNLPAPYCLTLGIEVGIQNAGMGLLITSTVLQQPTMTMVLVAYGLVMQLPMLLLAIYFRYYRVDNSSGILRRK